MDTSGCVSSVEPIASDQKRWRRAAFVDRHEKVTVMMIARFFVSRPRLRMSRVEETIERRQFDRPAKRS